MKYSQKYLMSYITMFGESSGIYFCRKIFWNRNMGSPLRRQDTVSYKKQEGFPQIKNSVVGIPAV